MSIRTSIVLIVFNLVHGFSLAAQSGGDPHRYDILIERFYEKNQRDSFLFYANEKLRLARQSDDLALWGWTQIDVHDFFSDHGNNEEALKILDAAGQQRWREPKNPEEWEPFLYMQQNRGWCLFEAGKVWQAVQAYESAAQLYERFRYPDFEAVETIYKPLGAHYTRLGDNEKALVILEKAKTMGGDNETIAGLYNNVGLAYWNQGDPAQACAFFRMGLDLGDISQAKTASLLAGLAQATLDVQWDNTESEKHEAGKAFGIASQALALLRTVSTSDPQYLQYRADARRTAGLAATKLDLYGEAMRLLTDARTDAGKAYGIISRDVGKIEVACSILLQKQGKFPAAIEAANRALQAVLPGFKPKNSKENPGLVSFYEENVIFEALEAKAMAAELLYQKSPDPGWLTLALECHDLAWQAEMRLRNVHQYSSSKLDLQKSARKREESAMRVARLLFEKTGHARYIEKAFAIAERSKATLLLEALQDNLLRQGAAGKDERFGQIDALRRSLAYFERSLLLEPANTRGPQWRIEADAIGSRITILERELAAAYPHLANPINTTSEALPQPGDLADDEALVTYFVRENTVDIIVLQKDKPAVWHILPYNDELKALVDRFFSFFSNSAAILNTPAEYLQTANRLWQNIVPAEAAAAARLLIIPDGFLNFIPFEALVVEAAGNGVSLQNAAYLIGRQNVRYTWSLAVLRRQNSFQSQADQLMLVIAPGFVNGERGLAPLLTGNNEWQSAGRGITTLMNKKADMAHFMENAGQYRILHFSTHAFSDVNPRIELIDQSLLLPDIYALPLQSDLVVLSACQTGLGLEQKGEGVMSLTRAFAQAGAAGIISSLWSVNNRSTASMMDRFYQNLIDHQSAGTALRQAKLAYIADPKINIAQQSPYFWAGLVQVGADRKITTGGFHLPVPALLPGAGILALLLVSYWYFTRRNTIR